MHQLPQRNITFKSWTNNHSTNSEISEDYEDIEWKPISRHQKHENQSMVQVCFKLEMIYSHTSPNFRVCA